MAEPLWNGEWILVHSDPFSGTQTYIQDLGDGRTAIKKITPVDQVLDSAAQDRAASAGKSWGDGQVIGTLPDSLYFTTGYHQAKQNQDTAWLKKFWNNIDFKYLRTKEGRI